jgi:tetratricopeptide (TPR) repeat protein
VAVAVRRVLSWKRFLAIVGVLGALAATAYGVHRVQERRHADALKAQAAQTATDPARADAALGLYERYLKFRPKDEEAHRDYVVLLLAKAKTDPAAVGRAAVATADFLVRFPNNPDQRRKLIDLYMKQGKVSLAQDHIKILFESGEQFRADVDLREKAATCEVAAGRPADAINHLKLAIDTGKAPVPTYERLLLLYWGHRSAIRDALTQANDLCRELIEGERFKSDVAAQVVAARFRLLTGDPASAQDRIQYALKNLPGGSTHPEALLTAAQFELDAVRGPEDAARVTTARNYLRQAFDAHPENVRVGVQLAEVLDRLGDRDGAKRVLGRTADHLGEPTDAMFLVTDRLLDLGDTHRAARLIEVVGRDQDLKLMEVYFRGRLAVLKGDWVAARELLTKADRAAPGFNRKDMKEYQKKLKTALGHCYQAIGNPDRQLQYFEAAAEIDLTFVQAMIGKADALTKLGEVEKALPLYRALVAEKGYGLTRYRPTLVRLELLATLKTAEGERAWKSFEDALGPPDARTAEIHLYHAEALAASGNHAGAVKLLDGIAARSPDYPAVWLALARIKYNGKAEPTLAELDAVMKAAGGDSPERRVARALLVVGRQRRPTADEFRKLADGADGFDPKTLPKFWAGLGEAASWAVTLQTTPEAVKAMQAVAIDFVQKATAADPRDLNSRAALLDLGLAAGRKDVADRALAEIAAIEGPNGPLGTLGRIAAELPSADRNPDRIRELRAEAERVRADRPGWSRVYVALAKLDRMAGQFDAELENYKLAIRTGDRTEPVIRRTVELLRERRKEVEATRLLNDLYTQVPLPDDLERFRAVMNLLARDVPSMERATIDKIAPPREKGKTRKDEHKLLLLRGSLLAAIRADAEAEEVFRDALALEDNIPETWTTLVTHLARTGKMAEAKKVVTKAEEKLKTNPPADPTARGKLVVALAGCYEIVGDLKTAADRYREAVKAAPRALSFNRELVFFLQRSGQGAEADKLLLELSADPAPELHRWAKRHRALTLVARPDRYAHRREALGLIEQNLAAPPTDSQDVKAKAVVLAVDPETRKEGMDTLRSFAERYELTPDEFGLLGQLYFDRGDVEQAVLYFRQAAQPGPGLKADHLATLVRAELARNQLGRAERTAERLRIFAPGSWEAVAETARVLHRKSQSVSDPAAAKKLADEARDLVLKYPATEQNPAFATAAAAPLLDEIGFPAEAEVLFRKALDANKSPGAHLPLAVFLIQHQRGGEAIDLARKYEAGTAAVVTAQVMSGAVRATDAKDTARVAAVETWLASKLEEYRGRPEYPGLLAARAEVLDARGKYDDAIAEYRRVVGASPEGKVSIAVNNLCMLIALREPARVGEAIEMMNHLIGVRGPAPSFLDTRAVCYLVAGGTYRDAAKDKNGPELALADLDLALTQRQQPVYRFHKAWAYHLLAKQAEKDVALREAKAGKLTAAMLHPLEREKLRELYLGFAGGAPE